MALPTSQRRPSVLPASRKDAACKAFEKLTKQVLPATHAQLARAIEREARDYRGQQAELEQNTRPGTDAANVDEEELDEGAREEDVDDESQDR